MAALGGDGRACVSLRCLSWVLSLSYFHPACAQPSAGGLAAVVLVPAAEVSPQTGDRIAV
jgi:hypothetical protein